MVKKMVLAAATAFALLFSAQYALADLAAVGPADPQTGFPEYYQDSNGLTVEIGTDPVLNIADPVHVGNAFSEQIGFGSEAFYWSADAALDLGGGNSALLVLALEAAFATETPRDGDQFVFTRIRIRVDAPVAGRYTVTHPYGVDTFDVEVPGVRSINDSIDIGSFTPDFTGALTSRVGPLLTAVLPAPPPGFVGDPTILQTVTGSPFGTNYFRIQGPGGIDVRTNQFTVSGKLFTGVVNAPLIVNRVSYKRDAQGVADIDVFATSAPTAALSVSGTGLPTIPMTGDGTGKFYARIHTTNGAALPTAVSVTANNPGNGPTTLTHGLVDEVIITKFEYDLATRIVSVEANSQDAFVSPILTALGLGDLFNGALDVGNFLVPSSIVTVTSSKGGQDTSQVNIVASGNIPPTAVNDASTAAPGAPSIISAAANDFDIDGAINAASILIVTPPATGTAVANANGTITYTAAGGADSFTYTIADDLGAVSNAATVAVAVHTPPVAVNDAVTTVGNTAILINAAANDTASAGSAINPATLLIVATPLSGAVVNHFDGTVTYTPVAGFNGTATFTYTVADSTGSVSNIGTVTVTVLPPETISVTTAVFRTLEGRWQVSGTDSVAVGGNTITIHLGSNVNGPVIGTAPVVAAIGGGGTWSFAVRNSPIIAQRGATVSVRSSNGAQVLAFPVRVR